MPPRILPIEPPYPDELNILFNKLMPPSAQVEPLRLFRTLAHNRDLTSRMHPLASGILGKATLNPTEREIVIHRTCARCGCEYEWGVHVVFFGGALNIPREKLDATVTASADDAIWTERESLLIRLADELHDTSTVSDELWGLVSQQWDTAQLIELCMVAGFYHLISFAANAARVEPEAWAARFPEETM